MMNWIQADPTLAGLAQAMDPTTAAALFAEQSLLASGQADAPLTIQDCRLQQLHYQPASQCTATYQLLIRPSSQRSYPTIGIMEMQAQRQTTRLYLADRWLPWLAKAADAATMREYFHPIYPAITDLQITPVRYKPNSRCVLRYVVSGGTETETCFGKSLAENAGQLATVLRTLTSLRHTYPELPSVPAVLAYWADLHMVVQAAVPGQEFHTLAFAPTVAATQRLAWFTQAGEAIAALHSVAQIPAPCRTYTDDLSELRAYLPAIERLDGQLAHSYATMLARLQMLAQMNSSEPAVPGHGALRTDQFLLEQDRLVLIDLDSFCWANPARDLGNFLAYLAWKALRQPQHAHFIAQAGQVFLASYQAARAGLDLHWLAFYQVLAMLKIVGRRFQGLTYQEWPLLPQLFATMRTLMPLLA